MLEPKDKRLLGEIARYVEKHKFPPSIKELKAALATTSTSVVVYHLNILERAELIRRTPNISRGIALTELGKRMLSRP